MIDKSEDYFVTNFPSGPETTVGRTEWMRAKRVGTVNYNGKVIKLYDYGTPHRIAVVRKSE